MKRDELACKICAEGGPCTLGRAKPIETAGICGLAFKAADRVREWLKTQGLSDAALAEWEAGGTLAVVKREQELPKGYGYNVNHEPTLAEFLRELRDAGFVKVER